MREALGGYYAYIVIVLFILVVSGFMAFTISYNKAFQMKNRAISVIEKYNNDVNNDNVTAELRDYARSIGYAADKFFVQAAEHGGYDCKNAGWCYKVVDVVGGNSDVKKSYDNGGKHAIDEYTSSYVEVQTFVSIQIPIFNKLFFPNIRFFRVTGATKTVNLYN